MSVPSQTAAGPSLDQMKNDATAHYAQLINLHGEQTKRLQEIETERAALTKTRDAIIARANALYTWYGAEFGGALKPNPPK